ncbi:hypothetical protein O6H91_05G119800 [Diphasiastrum complanatum]|uniref:Uncharacterized protein n=1 Tax=Diphasiastrum complanatum TaxID=34168 RepID=A0ACC2DSY3_DIPCM|nr:hypothetical protein O6H91_05G119800 [Diphasiastrum complanatum]
MIKGNGKPWRFPGDLQFYGRGAFRIGTSGYVYRHWKKIVYPERLPQKQWFEHYTRLFGTVEINNTFFRLPSSTVFENWHKQAPPGFCYALKFSRFVTHLKHLKDPDGPISLFLERALPLGLFRGPLLVQLPPKFDLNLERLKLFLNEVPRCYRWAIEVRDSRWLCDELYSLLTAHNASLVIHDHKDIPFRHPKIVTADWIYLRFHGHNYTQCYS